MVYYLDNFHTRLRGKIDGKEVPIERANLAFKAISLTQGSHTVEFSYFDGLRGVMSYLIGF